MYTKCTEKLTLAIKEQVLKNIKYHLFSKELFLISNKEVLGESQCFISWLTSVESKFSDYEYERLLDLLQATSTPAHLYLLPELIESLVNAFESFMKFPVEASFKTKLEADLKILKLLSIYLVEDGIINTELNIDTLLKPKKRFKLSFLLLTNFSKKISEQEHVDYINIVTFLLFQYQLKTKEQLYKGSPDTLVKIKKSGDFQGHKFGLYENKFKDRLVSIVRHFEKVDSYFKNQDTNFYNFLCASTNVKKDWLVEKELTEFISEERYLSSKNANPHSGSRLSLVERMLLPYRSNCLRGYELTNLLEGLTVEIQKKAIVDKALSLFTFLSLLTSKSDKYVKNLIFTIHPLDEAVFDYICIETNCWYRHDVLISDARKPTESHKCYLNSHSSIVALTMPKLVIQAIKEILQKQNLIIGLYSDLLAYSSTELKGHNLFKQSLTDAAIRSTMFSLMAKDADPNFAALALSNTEYVEPTHLYYLSLRHSDIQKQYYSILEYLNLELDEHKIVTQELIYSGSKLPVNFDLIKEQYSLLVKRINTCIEQAGDELREIINCHNMLACYTVLMLIAVTSHRPRKTYSFSRFTISKDKVLISDKIDNKYSAIRIVTLPEVVQLQIDSYRNHCKKVAKYLNDSNETLKEKLLFISSDINSGVCDFSCINDSFELEVIGKQQLAKFLPHNIDLPENYFRHALASYFRSKNKGKLAQEYLGHIRDGEHSLVCFSPISLNDNVDKLKHLLSSFLDELGFDLIKVSKLKGPFRKYPQVLKVYKPFKYKKEGVSNRTIYKWIMNEIKIKLDNVGGELVKENIEIIKPIFLEINQKVLTRWKKNNNQKRAQEILERILNNIKSGKKTTARYKFDSGLTIKNDLINDLTQSKLIKEEIKLIITQELDDNSKFFQLILSLIINTNRKLIFTPSLLNAIQGKWLTKGGMSWLTWAEQTVENRLIVDSVSACLKNNMPNLTKTEVFSNFERLKIKLEKNIQINKELVNKLKTLDDLSDFLSLNFDDDIPANLRYYRSGLTDCSCLTDSAMLRLCLNETFIVEDETDRFFLTSKSQKKIGIDNEIDLSDYLLQELRDEFNSLDMKKGYKTQVQLTNTILSVWQRNINSSATEEDGLLEDSSDLTSACCAILLWMIDVSKRKGKNRKTMGIGSLKTYLSNVAPSIMAVAKSDDIFTYNELSFLDLYIKALCYKDVDNEDERKRGFIDFHNALTSRGLVVDVNWTDVATKEYISRGDYNSNIITMEEYLSAIKLLSEDKYSTIEEKRVNQLCLIFCYRMGFRWDDFYGLKIFDVDIINMIISLKANEHRRLKSDNANRLIPAELLLSDYEKSLIEEQVSFLNEMKNVYKNNKFITIKVYSDAQEREKAEKKIATRVIQALKISTNDITSDLHDARRSFASYMTLLLNYSEGKAYFTSQLSQWCRSNDVIQFAQDIRSELTGSRKCTNKIMPALALLMGHSTPSTTSKYYIHIYDLLLYGYNEKQLEHNYPIKFIAEKLNIRSDLARQTLKRNRKRESLYSEYQCLVNKARLNNKQFQAVVTKNQQIKGANELSERIIKHSIFNDLFKLHKDVQILHEKFEIDEKLKDIVTTIKLKANFEDVQYPIEKNEFFYGVNYDFKHRSNDSENYINDKLFHQLCKTFDENIANNTVDLFELTDSWLEHFHPKLNLIIKKGGIPLLKYARPIKRSDLDYAPNTIKCLSEFVDQSELCMSIRSRTTQEKLQRVEYHEISNGITKGLYEQLDIKYPNKPKSVAKKFNYFLFLLTVYKMLNNYDEEKGIVKFSERNKRYI